MLATGWPPIQIHLASLQTFDLGKIYSRILEKVVDSRTRAGKTQDSYGKFNSSRINEI